jgi:uncharacterized protein
MAIDENVTLVLEAFDAVERRDNERLIRLFHPDIEFHWPPSLRYGGAFRVFETRTDASPTLRRSRRDFGYEDTWDPYQPTDADRSMDPRVVAASEREVVVLWRQKGVSHSGQRLDTPVLGLYEVRDGKLARAQMFYFDTVELARFLAEAKRQATTPKPEAVDR